MTSCARCTWQPDPDGDTSAREQLRAHALDWQHPLCCVCGRSLPDTHPQACEPCTVDTQQTLAAVLHLWTELPRELGHPKATPLDRDGRGGSEEHALPGGTVLALLAPGGTGQQPRRLTPTDRQRGLTGLEHAVDNQADSTPSVAWTLTTHEDDWRHTRGEPAADGGGSTVQVVRAAHGYLERHGRWAATSHPAYAEYATDLRELLVRLEVATGRVRRPVRAGAACFDCSGALVRPVDSDGLEVEDVVRCRQCGSSYSGARYLLALAAQRADALAGWVPYRAAAAAAARPLPTVWSWVQRLQVTAVCRVTDRTVLVWYPDVDARAGRKTRGEDVA